MPLWEVLAQIVLPAIGAGLVALWATLRMMLRHLYGDLKADRDRVLALVEQHVNSRIDGLIEDRETMRAERDKVMERLDANTDELTACREGRAAQQAAAEALQAKVEEQGDALREQATELRATNAELRALRSVVETKIHAEREPRRDAKGRFLPWGHDEGDGEPSA